MYRSVCTTDVFSFLELYLGVGLLGPMKSVYLSILVTI